MNRRPHVVSCRLSPSEMRRFTEVCNRHKVSLYVMLHALIIDAIEEEEDAIRRKQQEGRESGPKDSESCRAAA